MYLLLEEAIIKEAIARELLKIAAKRKIDTAKNTALSTLLHRMALSGSLGFIAGGLLAPQIVQRLGLRPTVAVPMAGAIGGVLGPLMLIGALER